MNHVNIKVNCGNSENYPSIDEMKQEIYDNLPKESNVWNDVTIILHGDCIGNYQTIKLLKMLQHESMIYIKGKISSLTIRVEINLDFSIRNTCQFLNELIEVKNCYYGGNLVVVFKIADNIYDETKKYLEFTLSNLPSIKGNGWKCLRERRISDNLPDYLKYLQANA